MESIACFIIKSYVKGEENWSGKEFSTYPAKMYFSYEDATEAIARYWYGNDGINRPDGRLIMIVPLGEIRKNILLKEKSIRL